MKSNLFFDFESIMPEHFAKGLTLWSLHSFTIKLPKKCNLLRMYKHFYLLIACVLASLTQGQEMNILQTNQSLVALNPSFAGSNGLLRNQLSCRNQWPNISWNYVRCVNTFDTYLRPIKAGIAVTGDYETQGAGLMKNTGFGVAYAQYIKLKSERAKIIPSVQAIYRQFVIDYTGLTFGGSPGFIWNSTQPSSAQEKRSYLDVNAGLLYTLDDRLFLGVAASHITSPKLDLTYDYNVSPAYSFYGSYNFVLSERCVFQIMFNAAKQNNFSTSRLGANVVLWKHFMAGGSWLSGDAMALNAGYRANTFVFLVGYDLTYGRLAGNSAGSWEFHASYNLRNKDNRTKLTSFEKM
jgi:type IX secretion system PorP/SprF family membrane protein